MRVLITCPHLSLVGGVANYSLVIRDWFSIEADFLEVGATKEKETVFDKIINLSADWTTLYKLFKKSVRTYDLIHLNSSLNLKAIVRDGLLLRTAKGFGYKTIVMFHGWDRKTEKFITNKIFNLFFSNYDRADAFIVLSSDFKNQMTTWGFRQPIYVETTAVSDSLLNGFSIENRIKRIYLEKTVQLLFLARIEEKKGIRETIEAAQKFSEGNIDFHLVVAGDGPFMEKARRFAHMVLKRKVSFLGYVNDEEKKKLLLNSDIYVLPTYGEGMPATVLEAMAFGLPVVTRPVGGLRDVLINGQHGFMTESKSPQAIASLIVRIIRDPDSWKRISVNVHEYAKERFMASKVTKRLEDIYSRTVCGK